MRKYVTLLEIGKKQTYIFRSNVLAENIGASIIIKNATERDARQFYQERGATVIYEGGGNALYVFPTKEDGVEFAKQYSYFILQQYPGITLYLVGYELKEEETVKDGITECYRLLAQKKNTKRHAAMTVDFGKTVRCASTNMPATDMKKTIPDLKYVPVHKRNVPVSAESARKYDNCKEQDEVFVNLLPEGYRFPKGGDKLGRTVGDKSYVAVIHIDGNRMGEKLRKFNERHEIDPGESTEEFDKRYMEDLGEFSRQIRKQYETSVKETFEILTSEANSARIKEHLNLAEGYLPVRPLILAGDDICFMADGRIGIELARICIEKIKEKKVMGTGLNACGGVAIVKSHYPFSRAYELAEELCQNAKDRIGDEEEDASYLDWHVDQAELDDDLAAIRKDYTAVDGSCLTMRPYLVGSHQKLFHMDNFYHHCELIMGKTDEKEEKDLPARSQIKALREVLKKGKDATGYFLKLRESGKMRENLCGKASLSNVNTFVEYDGNWHNLYFDAIEIMDILVRLEG